MDEIRTEKRGRPKLQEIKLQPGELDGVLALALKGIKSGRPAEYEDSPQGLANFKEKTEAYFQYLRDVNSNCESNQSIIADTESYCSFLSISRATLLSYQKNRSEEWREYIELVKTAITAVKKNLAFHQRIPTVLAIFDLCNNSNYVNSSEFKLSTAPQNERPNRNRTPEQIAAEYGEDLSMIGKRTDFSEGMPE